MLNLNCCCLNRLFLLSKQFQSSMFHGFSLQTSIFPFVCQIPIPSPSTRGLKGGLQRRGPHASQLWSGTHQQMGQFQDAGIDTWWIFWWSWCLTFFGPTFLMMKSDWHLVFDDFMMVFDDFDELPFCWRSHFMTDSEHFKAMFSHPFSAETLSYLGMHFFLWYRSIGFCWL